MHSCTRDSQKTMHACTGRDVEDNQPGLNYVYIQCFSLNTLYATLRSEKHVYYFSYSLFSVAVFLNNIFNCALFASIFSC